MASAPSTPPVSNSRHWWQQHLSDSTPHQQPQQQHGPNASQQQGFGRSNETASKRLSNKQVEEKIKFLARKNDLAYPWLGNKYQKQEYVDFMEGSDDVYVDDNDLDPTGRKAQEYKYIMRKLQGRVINCVQNRVGCKTTEQLLERVCDSEIARFPESIDTQGGFKKAAEIATNCYKLALIRTEVYGNKFDSTRPLVRACQGGHALACYNIGQELLNEEQAFLGHHPHHPYRVFETGDAKELADHYFKMSCERGFGPACHNVGVSNYEHNKNVVKDLYLLDQFLAYALETGLYDVPGITEEQRQKLMFLVVQATQPLEEVDPAIEPDVDYWWVDLNNELPELDPVDPEELEEVRREFEEYKLQDTELFYNPDDTSEIEQFREKIRQYRQLPDLSDKDAQMLKETEEQLTKILAEGTKLRKELFGDKENVRMLKVQPLSQLEGFIEDWMHAYMFRGDFQRRRYSFIPRFPDSMQTEEALREEFKDLEKAFAEEDKEIENELHINLDDPIIDYSRYERLPSGGYLIPTDAGDSLLATDEKDPEDDEKNNIVLRYVKIGEKQVRTLVMDKLKRRDYEKFLKDYGYQGHSYKALEDWLNFGGSFNDAEHNNDFRPHEFTETVDQLHYNLMNFEGYPILEGVEDTDAAYKELYYKLMFDKIAKADKNRARLAKKLKPRLQAMRDYIAGRGIPSNQSPHDFFNIAKRKMTLAQVMRESKPEPDEETGETTPIIFEEIYPISDAEIADLKERLAEKGIKMDAAAIKRYIYDIEDTDDHDPDKRFVKAMLKAHEEMLKPWAKQDPNVFREFERIAAEYNDSIDDEPHTSIELHGANVAGETTYYDVVDDIAEPEEVEEALEPFFESGDLSEDDDLDDPETLQRHEAILDSLDESILRGMQQQEADRTFEKMAERFYFVNNYLRYVNYKLYGREQDRILTPVEDVMETSIFKVNLENHLLQKTMDRIHLRPVLPFFLRGCQLHEHYSCRAAFDLITQIKEFSEDEPDGGEIAKNLPIYSPYWPTVIPELARKLALKGCVLGDNVLCNFLPQFYETQDDIRKAKYWYMRLCDDYGPTEVHDEENSARNRYCQWLDDEEKNMIEGAIMLGSIQQALYDTYSKKLISMPLLKEAFNQLLNGRPKPKTGFQLVREMQLMAERHAEKQLAKQEKEKEEKKRRAQQHEEEQDLQERIRAALDPNAPEPAYDRPPGWRPMNTGIQYFKSFYAFLKSKIRQQQRHQDASSNDNQI
eukprot:GEZU01025503.1.p1 GENE.GEZU01025503.1~~GEZU01025503.1.p1  ORF type:complete len:1237 (-),score=380.35 GEZU01025503.1:233-3943(-)